MTRNVLLSTSLPMTLASMILYSISAANKCRYCSAIFKVTCVTVGIDEGALAALDSDLEDLTPMRAQVIIKFARKCALDRTNLSEADFDEVRAQGIGDGEIAEIVSLAALGNYLNTVADSLRADVDEVIASALAG